MRNTSVRLKTFNIFKSSSTSLPAALVFVREKLEDNVLS